MSMNYGYNYVEIDLDTGECLGMFSSAMEIPEDQRDECIIPIPVNDPEYIGKYYINGAWYEDAEGTTPWTSSLL